MKPYKLKHIPSGYYYQPIKDGNNLSKRGKIYQTKSNILSMGFYSNGEGRRILTIDMMANSPIYKELKDKFTWRQGNYFYSMKMDTLSTDWIIEEI